MKGEEMYIVIELQTAANGSVANIVTQYNDLNQAESAYHMILAAAAISALPEHSATILTNRGQLIATEYYTHEAEE